MNYDTYQRRWTYDTGFQLIDSLDSYATAYDLNAVPIVIGQPQLIEETVYSQISPKIEDDSRFYLSGKPDVGLDGVYRISVAFDPGKSLKQWVDRHILFEFDFSTISLVGVVGQDGFNFSVSSSAVYSVLQAYSKYTDSFVPGRINTVMRHRSMFLVHVLKYLEHSMVFQITFAIKLVPPAGNYVESDRVLSTVTLNTTTLENRFNIEPLGSVKLTDSCSSSFEDLSLSSLFAVE